MAQKRVKFTVCDRCIADTRATSHEKFTFMGTDYELDLCDKHADMLQRDLSAWTRVAREVERPTFFPPAVELPRPERVIPLPEISVVETAKNPEPVEPALEEIPVAALRWKWSEHAEERLASRGAEFGFNRRDVLLAVANGVTYPIEDDPKRRRKVLGKVSVVVEPRSRKIVTVMPNSSAWGKDLDRVKETV